MTNKMTREKAKPKKIKIQAGLFFNQEILYGLTNIINYNADVLDDVIDTVNRMKKDIEKLEGKRGDAE